ncbi:hypothetical protein MKK75_23715 [Methylobacterium sp. J-030]|uniref:hypothetical protein n=1 Tax=Methylobacterium sp. J-030 TaxID=2836627 RepID=UPI001FBB76AC|nr:hypothetical protein [Methylobacterium sp. J-030]MCJ2071770.1 hypothetical protein [Methylobacterium sp. J-030]
MPEAIPHVASPRNASPLDPSVYELSPGGRAYFDRMATVIGRRVPGHGTVTELGLPSSELYRILRDRSASTDARIGAGEYDLVLTQETDVARPDVLKLLSRGLDTARRAVV